MPRLRLPPLPPAESWALYFPKQSLGRPPDAFSSKEFPGRIFLTNPALNDEFVRALKLRSNDIVIESWPGPGQLTRSLVNGGNGSAIAEGNEAWINDFAEKHPGEYKVASTNAEEVTGTQKKSRIKKDVAVKIFPEWTKEMMDGREDGVDVKDDRGSSSKVEYPIPRRVVAVESASDIMISGLGLQPDQALPPVVYMDLERDGAALDSRAESMGSDKPSASRALRNPPPIAIYPSMYEDNLILAPGSPYVWRTMSQLLATKGIVEHVEEAEGEDVVDGPKGHRRWSAEPPNVIHVCQLPDSVVGEALAGQWVVSAIGAAEGKAQWAWRWGRMKMAFLMGRGLYDRMTAKAGEGIRCKMSVLTEALFHLEPLPPYHHVPNVDRSSVFVDARLPSLSQKTPAAKAMFASYVGLNLPRTVTWPRDFWPIRQRKADQNTLLPRPILLGLQLIPREKTVIKDDQRDSWEYVLRHCFVRQSIPISDGVKTLGFGASSMMKDVADMKPESIYAGVGVDPATLVRDLSVEEWARVVDVFHNWAFRPKHLVIPLLGEVLEGKEFLVQ